MKQASLLFKKKIFFEKNIQVQTKLHIVYIGMLQVTRSNIGFYLYIIKHIYLSIKVFIYLVFIYYNDV